MVRRRVSPLLKAGLFAFAAGAGLRAFGHGRYVDFSAGVLLGISLVFLIAGLAWQPRRDSK